MDTRVRRDGHPMPEIAAFVSKLREAFGDEVIDDAVRQGKAGEPSFYACENGRAVGTVTPLSTNSRQVDESIRGRRYCHGCDGECIGQGTCCSDWLKRRSKEKER
ncbi:hypothetical protein PQR33_13375 [Paraburkholderia sediminicola]|uniref:hypothetical protein n=1 Tax=Paraburkholderia sediminicola TaxID=458836 RepID=UPI0038B7E0FD